SWTKVLQLHTVASWAAKLESASCCASQAPSSRWCWQKSATRAQAVYTRASLRWGTAECRSRRLGSVVMVGGYSQYFGYGGEPGGHLECAAEAQGFHPLPERLDTQFGDISGVLQQGLEGPAEGHDFVHPLAPEEAGVAALQAANGLANMVRTGQL